MITWFTQFPWFQFFNFNTLNFSHHIRFEKNTRYYTLSLEQDLLDDWTITVTNGQIKSKLGQSRTIAYTSFDEAFYHYCLFIVFRYHRGYQTPLLLDPVIFYAILQLPDGKLSPPTVKQISKRRQPSTKFVQEHAMQLGLKF